MKSSKIVLSILTLAILFTACQSLEFKKTKSGLPYKIFPGSGKDSAKPGNIIKFQYKTWIEDSLLGSSYDNLPAYVPVGQSQPYDVSELFEGLKKGDSVIVIQSVDTFLKRNQGGVGMPSFLKPGKRLKTAIKVLEVFKTSDQANADYSKELASIQSKEDADITAYLKKNNINASKTAHGTYVQVLDSGRGAVVEPNKQVAVKYKGSTFNGKVFDTNMDESKGHTDPLTFVTQQGQMIPGFDEGILSLKEGAKARLYIPSVQGYSSRPPSPEIKPFENLIFDVEILKVGPAPQTQPMQFPQMRTDSSKKSK